MEIDRPVQGDSQNGSSVTCSMFFGSKQWHDSPGFKEVETLMFDGGVARSCWRPWGWVDTAVAFLENTICHSMWCVWSEVFTLPSHYMPPMLPNCITAAKCHCIVFQVSPHFLLLYHVYQLYKWNTFLCIDEAPTMHLALGAAEVNNKHFMASECLQHNKWSRKKS